MHHDGAAPTVWESMREYQVAGDACEAAQQRVTNCVLELAAICTESQDLDAALALAERRLLGCGVVGIHVPDAMRKTRSSFISAEAAERLRSVRFVETGLGHPAGAPACLLEIDAGARGQLVSAVGEAEAQALANAAAWALVGALRNMSRILARRAAANADLAGAKDAQAAQAQALDEVFARLTAAVGTRGDAIAAGL